MSDDRYRLAFSHMLVAGTTIWCIYNVHKPGGWDWEWIYGAYGSLCLYSFVGTWRYGNPEYGDDAANLYDFSSKLVQAFAGSSFVTELYLRYGYQLEYAAIHAALPLIPITLQVAKNEWEQELVDSIVLGTSISGTILSVLQENYFGIVANVNALMNHFVLRNREIADVPTKVFYNVGLCFFLFYSYKAMSEAGVIIPAITK